MMKQNKFLFIAVSVLLMCASAGAQNASLKKRMK